MKTTKVQCMIATEEKSYMGTDEDGFCFQESASNYSLIFPLRKEIITKQEIWYHCIS